MKNKKIVIYLVLIIVVSSYFVLKTSYFMGHDLDFHLSRIISIKDCIGMKKICYVAPNYLNGYGYGTPLFYPDIFLIFPAILLSLGVSLTISYRIFIFLINALSIWSMYFCVNKLTNKKTNALFSAFLYAFTSYRVLDITARAALGETISFIFFPLIILGIYELLYRNYKNYKYLVIGMSGLILSHLLSSVIVFIYLVILCFINIKKLFQDKKRLKYLIISAMITLLITAYFIFPMLEQLFTSTYKLSLESTILKDRAMPFYYIFLEAPLTQLFAGESWLWSPGTVGTILILIIILYFLNVITKEKYSIFIKQNLYISLLFIIFTTRLIPWNLLQHAFHVIQFPWRLYIIPSILIPLIGSSIIGNKNKPLLVVILVMGLCSVKTITTYHNITYVDKDSYKNYEIMWQDYLPVNLSVNYINNRDDIISSNKEFKYKYKKKKNILTINFKNNSKNTLLELPFVYYKGYSAYINNNKVPVRESLNGLVNIMIDEEYQKGKIKVFYEGTWIQKTTKYISIISLIVFILLNIKKLKIRQ